MTQPDAKLVAKWEKRLKKGGLGIVQPLTDNSEGEIQLSMGTHDDDLFILRNKIDSGDRFMQAHQITKVRSKEREIPDWVFDNKEVQRVVLTSFPKLKVHALQKAKAARWVQLIYLYYRMGLPLQVVAKEMSVSKPLIKRWLQSINRAERGLTNANGKPRRVTSPTPLEGTTEGRHENK